MSEGNIITKAISFVGRIFNERIDGQRGVHSMFSWKFWVCLTLLVLAACTLAGDSLFFDEKGGFQFNCGILCILLSFIALSAAFWDLLMFGKPQGGNLLLHCITIIPFTLFSARAILKLPATVESRTVLGKVCDALVAFDNKFIGLSKSISAIVPDWILDIFHHWPIALALLFVVGALSIKKKECKVALLFFAFFACVAGALAAQVSWQFILGTIFLIGALALMYDPCDEQCFYYNLIRELGREKISEVELDVISKIVCEAYRRGRLSENEVRELIVSRLDNFGIDCGNDVSKSCGALLDRMAKVHNLIRLVGDSTGMYLTVHPRVADYNCRLTPFAVYPRNVIIAILGFIWLISPLDLLPDAIPVLGLLDDAVISLLSAKCIGMTRNRDSESYGNLLAV